LLGIGLSSFLLDISMGILIFLFNNQINVLTNKDATILGVFGIICNMMTLVQSFSYAVGQASQPLLSEAFGKENTGRIKKIKKYGLVSSLAVGIFFFVLFMADPPFWSGFSSIRKPIRKQSVSGRNSSVFSSLLCPCFP
jgi:Na+-driven multidrug efflux pump